MDELIQAIQDRDVARFHACLGVSPQVFTEITPLMYAAQSNFTAAIPYLDVYLNQRCRAARLFFPLHATALQIAALSGSAGASLLLLKEAELSGFSTLLQAVACRNCAVLRTLLQQLRRAQFAVKLSQAQRVFGDQTKHSFGSGKLNQTDRLGQSPAEETLNKTLTQTNQEEQGTKLRERPNSAELARSDGLTNVLNAEKLGSPSVISTQNSTNKLASGKNAQLGDVLAVFARRDSLNRTFLHYVACWHSQTSEEAVQAEALLGAAAQLNLLGACDSGGKNCLHVAAAAGNAWFCQRVLGVCPQLFGSACAGGTTALMIAADLGYEDVAHLLLPESGLRDADGWRAIDHARAMGNQGVLQMLAECDADQQIASQNASATHSNADSSIPSPPPCAHVAISPTLEAPHSSDAKPLNIDFGFQAHANAGSVIRQTAESQQTAHDQQSYATGRASTSQQPAAATPERPERPERLKQDLNAQGQQTLREYAIPLADSLEISAVDHSAETALAVSRLAQDNSSLQKQVQDAKSELAAVIVQYEEKMTRMKQLYDKQTDLVEEMAGLIPSLIK